MIQRDVIAAALSLAIVLGAQAPTSEAKPSDPRRVDSVDRLSVREMQITALQNAMRLKDEEIKMLRARIEYFEAKERMAKEQSDLGRNNQDLDAKAEALRMKYGASQDYRLTFDIEWEKTKAPVVTTGGTK